jgi:hypothetical protein
MIAVGRSDAKKTRRSQLIAGILLAALGLVLSGVGMVLLSWQAADYVETARWPEYSLLDLIKSPTVKFTLPGGLLSWVYRPESLKDLHAAVIGCLDWVSASWFFLVMGGFILWRALR